jgi:murein DD-endopeptidase MepM/ murein hydrolase activator NlpD
MVAETSGWGSKLFPEVRICFRSSTPLVISPLVQAAVLSGLVAGAAAFAYLGASRLNAEHLLTKRAAEAALARTADGNLQREIDTLRHMLVALTEDRDRVQSKAGSLVGRAETLRNRLATAEANLGSLDRTEQALQQEKARSADLSAQLGKMQSERAAEQGQFAQYKTSLQSERAAEERQFAQYKASLEQTAKELEELSTLRSRPYLPRARVRARLGEIWQKLSQVQLPLPGDATSAVAARTNSASSEQPSGVDNPGVRDVATLESALRSAGVDVTRILSQFGANQAQGGPFVPPPKTDPGAASNAGKLAAIEALAKTLPISAPLARYEIGSGFGPRIDPFNGRASFHTGLDMDAPYSSPVYAAAAGTVIYSGWLGDYGEVVEIDHGFGIVTLYAHLRRCLVAAGQNVAARAEIGLVGVTGRSTGPHVHYEVRVDGQPQDPEKFLSLAPLLPTAPGQLIQAAAPAAENSR